MKGRTDEEGNDPVTDKPTDDASVRGELESRHGGKHGTPQERTTMIERVLDPENLAAAWTAMARSAKEMAKPNCRAATRING